MNGCTDRDLYNPKMMDLSDFADNFDINIPPIDNVDSGIWISFVNISCVGLRSSNVVIVSISCFSPYKGKSKQNLIKLN